MYEVNAVEVKSLVLSVNLEGMETLLPSVNEEAILFESYSCEYSILNLDDVEFLEAYTNKDNVTSLIFSKEFSNKSDEDIKLYMNGLSDVMIEDDITGAIYSAKINEIESFDIAEY